MICSECGGAGRMLVYVDIEFIIDYSIVTGEPLDYRRFCRLPPDASMQCPYCTSGHEPWLSFFSLPVIFDDD